MSISQKPFELLVFLLENPCRVISKEEMIQTVWAGTIVEDSNVSQSIFLLRKALRDASGKDHFIVTIPGKGYQWTVAPEVAADGLNQVSAGRFGSSFSPEIPSENASRAGTLHPPPTGPWRLGPRLALVIGVTLLVAAVFEGYRDSNRIRTLAMGPVAASPTGIERSVAVLPFENLSQDKDDAYFADGIQNEILTRLARIGSLKVVARSSTVRFGSSPENLPEIGSRLGVAALLEGSVQRHGDSVHINVQLIRAQTSENLWAETYDRNLDDVFEVQSDVAQRVAIALSAQLTGAEHLQLAEIPTRNLPAYEAYLRGVASAGRPDTGNAIKDPQAEEAFNTAVGLDPNFALAWAELSHVESRRYRTQGHAAKYRDAASQALDRAMALAPSATETQMADGYFLMDVKQDVGGARAVFEALLPRAPQTPKILLALAGIARSQGRWDDAHSLLQQAMQIDPFDYWFLILGIRTDIDMRKFDAAKALIQRGLYVKPDSSVLVHYDIVALQALGEIDAAQSILEQSKFKNVFDLYPDSLGENLMLAHQYESGFKFFDALLKGATGSDEQKFDFRWTLATFEKLTGRTKSAKNDFQKTLDLIPIEYPDPEDPRRASARSSVDVGLGDFPAALEQARLAIFLLPETQDAAKGPALQEQLAHVEALAGDKEDAFKILEQLVGVPYDSEPPITPALLRLDPDWQSLRDDPRFSQLLADAEAALRAAQSP